MPHIQSRGGRNEAAETSKRNETAPTQAGGDEATTDSGLPSLSSSSVSGK